MQHMLRLLRHKGFSVFLAAFVVVLLSGVAVAQVGSFSASDDAGNSDGPGAFVDSEAIPETTAPPWAEKEPGAEDLAVDSPEDEEPVTEVPAEGDGDEVEDERPILRIKSPENRSHTEERVIAVKGVTDPLAALELGDRSIEVGDDGSWGVEVELEEGENILEFVATGENGLSRDRRLIIFYEAPVVEPKPEPEPEPEPEHKFSAHQKWEAVDGDPLVNLYWGTAKPGHKVYIVAPELGSTTVVANDQGKWEAKLVIEGHVENGQKIKVVVETDGGRAEFHFIAYTGEEPEHKFTAYQKYGSCGEEIPYDVFHGTDTPGNIITVTSDHGSAETKVKEDGTWKVKVFFPEAPFNKPFGVLAKSSGGGVEDFGFVRTGDAH